jgi:hypothetical protein
MDTQQPTALPAWRVRLIRVQEHETIPTAKPGRKPLSEHAAAAKLIRQTLKRVFPGTAFTVTSDCYSGGDSVHVSWTDGPTEEMVEQVVDRHQEGHFDGSIDLYQYSNDRDDIPQVMFVHCQRRPSPAAFAATVALVNRRYGWDLRVNDRIPTDIDHTSDAPRDNGYGYRSHELHRAYARMALFCPACDAATLPGDAFCPMCGDRLEELPLNY